MFACLLSGTSHGKGGGGGGVTFFVLVMLIAELSKRQKKNCLKDK